MSDFNKALALAFEAHANQFDKAGEPYVLHPIRVASSFTDEPARIVAVLHDVLEDNKQFTPDRLRAEGFDEEIVRAVVALTRHEDTEGEDAYLEYICSLSDEPLAGRVKLADLNDNMNISRIPTPTEKDFLRVSKYRRAYSILRKALREREISELTQNETDPKRVYAIRYARIAEDYECYARVLREVLERLCSGVAPQSIVQVRAKKVASFTEKLVRKNYCDGGRNPFDRCTDLCGGRVITQTMDQANEIAAFIEKHFNVDYQNSLDAGKRLSTKEFGYRSLHYVISIKSDNLLGMDTKPEITGDLKAEIQIRTMLQHAWSDCVHDRLYKSPFKVMDKYERDSSRIAAALEVIDNQFKDFIYDFDKYSINFTSYLPENAVLKIISNNNIIKNLEASERSKRPYAYKNAELYTSLGMYAEAVEQLSPYVNEQNALTLPSEAVTLGYALCSLADFDLMSKDFVRGEKLLKAIEEQYRYLDTDRSNLWLKEKKLYTKTLVCLADCVIYSGMNPSLAENALSRAYRLEPENPYILNRIIEVTWGASGRFEMLSGAIANGVSICRAHIASEIELPNAYLAMGRLELAAENNDAALEAYSQAINYVNLHKDIRHASIIELFKTERIFLNKTVHSREAARLIIKLINNAIRHWESGDAPQSEELVGVGHFNIDVSEIIHINLDDEPFAQIDSIDELIGDGSKRYLVVVSGGGHKASLYCQIFVSQGHKLLIYDDASKQPLANNSLYADSHTIAAIPYEKETLLGLFAKRLTDFDEETIITAARLTHDNYKNIQDAKLQRILDRCTEQFFRDTPAALPWEELPEDYRHANIDQVRYWLTIFGLCGYEIVQRDANANLYQIPSDDLEHMAKLEHGRWNAERLLQGWRYAPVRDDAKKLHDCITCWDNLTDEIKMFDREAIKTAVRMLHGLGYTLRRA